MKLRRITAADDAAMAKIVRDNLEKLHLDIPGTAYYDPELDHLSSYYNSAPEKRCYFIAWDDEEQIIGGVGVAEFGGMENGAELQKLYLSDSVKGKGYSKELVHAAEAWAKDAGYTSLYLETHRFLQVAMALYRKMGFEEIEKPAAVLHSTMDHFFLKRL